MHAYMQWSDEAGTVARWHGGEYIDVGSVQTIGEAGIDGDDFHAYDVINVWDYAAGKPRIPRTLEAFQARCEEWMRERDDEDE